MELFIIMIKPFYCIECCRYVLLDDDDLKIPVRNIPKDFNPWKNVHRAHIKFLKLLEKSIAKTTT
jgi:hypothetical protein